MRRRAGSRHRGQRRAACGDVAAPFTAVMVPSRAASSNTDAEETAGSGVASRGGMAERKREPAADMIRERGRSVHHAEVTPLRKQVAQLPAWQQQVKEQMGKGQEQLRQLRARNTEVEAELAAHDAGLQRRLDDAQAELLNAELAAEQAHEPAATTPLDKLRVDIVGVVVTPQPSIKTSNDTYAHDEADALRARVQEEEGKSAGLQQQARQSAAEEGRARELLREEEGRLRSRGDEVRQLSEAAAAAAEARATAAADTRAAAAASADEERGRLGGECAALRDELAEARGEGEGLRQQLESARKESGGVRAELESARAELAAAA
eukprot:gene55076-8228_t